MLKRLFLLMLCPSLLFAAAQKEQLSTAKTRTSPLLKTVAGGQKGVHGIILDYLVEDFLLDKTIKTSWPVELLSYSPDGKEIMSVGSPDGKIFIWDVTTGNLLRTLQGHTKRVTSAVYSPDGKTIASGSHDDTVRIWDAVSGIMVKMFEIESGRSTFGVDVAFDDDGKKIAFIHGRIFEVKPDVGQSYKFSGNLGDLKKIYFDKNNNLIVIGRDDIIFFDLPTKTLAVAPFEKIIMPVVFAYDRTRNQLAIGQDDGTIMEAFYKDELLYGRWFRKKHNKKIIALAYSHDGNYLASSSDDGAITIWNTESGKPITDLPQETGKVLSLAYSIDGSLAVGTEDGVIKIYKRQDIAMAEAEEVDQSKIQEKT